MKAFLFDFVKFFQIMKDVILTFAAVVGALVAFFGLKTWQKQLKGRTEYELARRLLRAVYKVRDSVHMVRNPWIPEREVYESLKETGIEAERKNIDSRFISESAVYDTRWKKVTEALSDLKVETTEAEVLWGREINEQIKPLHDCVNKLALNIHLYLTQVKEGDGSGLDKKDKEEIFDTIYRLADIPEKDPFAGKLQDAITQIELFVKPYLKI